MSIQKEKVDVLSLFDGMACGMIAFKKLGIEVGNYYAYEIDDYAIKTVKHNFPEISELGNVFDADFTVHKGVDYLVGGSPCTHWSIAQRRNRETEASGIGWELFSQYVRALKEAQPKFFLYENNRSMAQPIYQAISETFGFEPIMINSALVSAQNRERYYWVGKRNTRGGYDKVNVPQPADRGILLKDVLSGVTDREKSRAIIGSIGRTTTREYFKKHQGQMALIPVNTTSDGKSRAVKAQYTNTGVRNILGDGFPATGVAEQVANRVGLLPNSDGTVSNSQGSRIYSTDGKAVALKANGGGGCKNRFVCSSVKPA